MKMNGVHLVSKLDHRNIEKVADRCGGRAVIAGTRVRVATILACYRQGMTVEEILQEYAHLRPADVHDALAYAYEHSDEIREQLRSEKEFAESMEAAQGPTKYSKLRDKLMRDKEAHDDSLPSG